MKYTRKQYMNKEVSHSEYYGQWGEKLTGIVGKCIGVDVIEHSTDPHFNDVPLYKWDRLAQMIRQCVGRDIAKANGTGGVSLSDCVCAAKSAASIIRGDT